MACGQHEEHEGTKHTKKTNLVFFSSWPSGLRVLRVPAVGPGSVTAARTDGMACGQHEEHEATKNTKKTNFVFFSSCPSCLRVPAVARAA
jgi:hypothetical protein